MNSTNKPVTICLAASGGGHLRQILDLRRFWQDHAHFIVTEDTALGRSIARDLDTEFVPHFAVGQARLGAPFKMLAGAFRSIWQSFDIIRRRRPDWVISTGAGSQCLIVLWARLFGARIILVDSFARFDKPSKFALLCGPLAHHRIAQSKSVAALWKGAECFDPLTGIEGPDGAKEDLLFATVGATLPFERLTRLVTEAKKAGEIPEKVILQVGSEKGTKEDIDGLQRVAEIPFDEIQQTLRRARIVICHGGTGSMITALQNGCATIVIPRLFDLGEHYDNHQLEIAESFAERGLVFLAHDGESLRAALLAARQSTPRAVTTDYAPMIEHLRKLIG